MGMFITGVKDGKSCIVEQVETGAGSDSLLVTTLLDIPLNDLPPRATGSARHHEIHLPPDTVRWLRVYFPPNTLAALHHTDSIDCNTVVAGSAELILDDGPHKVTVGDSFAVNGVDHGWRTGDEGCTLSILLIGLPPR